MLLKDLPGVSYFIDFLLSAQHLRVLLEASSWTCYCANIKWLTSPKPCFSQTEFPNMPPSSPNRASYFLGVTFIICHICLERFFSPYRTCVSEYQGQVNTSHDERPSIFTHTFLDCLVALGTIRQIPLFTKFFVVWFIFIFHSELAQMPVQNRIEYF